MPDPTPLDILRHRLGIDDARERAQEAGEVGAAILPALNGILAYPREPHLLHPTAALCGLSPFRFSSVFKAVLGMGFHDLVVRVRVDRALRRLAETPFPIEAVARECGFKDEADLRLSVEEGTGLPFLLVLSLLGRG